MATISAVLSPSVKIFKILPDLKPLMDKFGTNEPNVIIPSFSCKKIMQQENMVEKQNLMQTMTDMMSPEILHNQMETQQTNVPPGKLQIL